MKAKSEVKSASEPVGLCGLSLRFPNLEAKKGINIALRWDASLSKLPPPPSPLIFFRFPCSFRGVRDNARLNSFSLWPGQSSRSKANQRVVGCALRTKFYLEYRFMDKMKNASYFISSFRNALILTRTLIYDFTRSAKNQSFHLLWLLMDQMGLLSPTTYEENSINDQSTSRYIATFCSYLD